MPRALMALAGRIDAGSASLGRAVSWLTLLMVLIGTYNAVARAVGSWLHVSLTSPAGLEAQWYLFSAVFLLAASDTLRRNGHVRVDVVHGRLTERSKAWVDLAGTVLLLCPFAIAAIWLCWPSVMSSIAVRESSPDPGGLPRYPLKALLLVAFALLLIQGVSEVIKRIAFLRRGGDAA